MIFLAEGRTGSCKKKSGVCSNNLRNEAVGAYVDINRIMGEGRLL
jgi:hypothetical protein